MPITNRGSIEHTLTQLLNRVGRSMRSAVNQELVHQGFKITMEQMIVLMYLRQKDGQPQQELAVRLNKNKAAITKVVDQLERRALISRKHDPHDRRHKLIYLTDTAKTLWKKADQVMASIINTACLGIEETALHTTCEVLEQVVVNLEANQPQQPS